MQQDDLYEEVSTTLGAALERLARSFEADPDKRRDLLQDIHFALWRSLANFAGGCSLRTWAYRVAHNVAASYVLQRRRARQRTVSLEELENAADPCDAASHVERALTLDRLYAFIQQLQPIDREVVLLYLEGVDAAGIGEVTGLSSGNVATKIHRVKKILGRELNKGGHRG